MNLSLRLVVNKQPFTEIQITGMLIARPLGAKRKDCIGSPSFGRLELERVSCWGRSIFWYGCETEQHGRA
jgi:hypothetical protein